MNYSNIRHFVLILLMIFISCKKVKVLEIENELEINNKMSEEEQIILEIDSALLSYDSIIVNSSKFYIKYFNNEFWKDKVIKDCNLILFNSNKDTLYKHDGLTNGFEIKDFNEDGYKDIKLDYLFNLPNVADMLLFDTATINFKPVKNFSNYPSAIKIQGTKYYYSYHRSGCADANWDSDLFYIENFECFKIGNISGRGCEGEERNGIIISKIKKNKEIEIEYIKREAEYYGNKWDYIDNYWKTNYKKFIQK